MKGSGSRIRPARGAAALGILLLWGAAASVGAQARESILQRGPIPVRSLPYFPPNALKAFQGEYRAEDRRIVVYFTREPLVLPAAWRQARCGQAPLVRVPAEEGFTLCHAEPGEAGYFLFFDFESDAFPWCAWTEVFLPRFRYLLAFAKSPSEVPFPCGAGVPEELARARVRGRSGDRWSLGGRGFFLASIFALIFSARILGPCGRSAAPSPEYIRQQLVEQPHCRRLVAHLVVQQGDLVAGPEVAVALVGVTFLERLVVLAAPARTSLRRRPPGPSGTGRPGSGRGDVDGRGLAAAQPPQERDQRQSRDKKGLLHQ